MSPRRAPVDDTPESFRRAPAVHQLSLQLRGHGQRLLEVDVDLFTDVMHLQPTPGPSWFRVGLDYRY